MWKKMSEERGACQCPLLLLPLSAYICNTKSLYDNDNLSADIKTYLDAIKFPTGISKISIFEKEARMGKNYTPISILKRSADTERERLESLFQEMIYKILGATEGTRSAIYQPISELVTNIFEHSKSDEGFVFSQFYPNKNYLDICIIDCGRGLPGSYKEEKGLSLSDGEALIEVMNGHSTKANKERGFGVRTSKDVVCRGLGGEFIMLSGSAVVISNEKEEKMVNLPDFSWHGVVIAYRIPKPTGPIDIYQYLE